MPPLEMMKMTDVVKTADSLLPLPSGTTPAPIAMPTPDQLVVILTAIDKNLPTLKSFLAAAQANPVMLKLASTFFPNLAGVIPLLTTLTPYLDFLQQLDEQVLAALQAP